MSIIILQMSKFEFRQTQSLETRQEQRMMAKLEQVAVLELPEEDFHRLITEVEQSPLFQRLYRKEKVVRYQRFPGTDISPHFHEIKEEVLADRGSLDIESLLLNKEGIVRQIQRLGIDKFRRYFLCPEEGMSLEEIAAECRLDLNEVKEINRLVDEFSVHSEFYHPSTLEGARAVRYSKVASVERGKDGFVIAYFSPHLARGRYAVDHEKVEELASQGAFSEEDMREVRRLLRKLELINSRKDTITRTIQAIVDKQALYLESGQVRALLPFTQKELAQKLEVVPSSVSRAISHRSVDTPWGEEPLKTFFPRPRKFRKELVRRLLELEGQPLSDEALRRKLEEAGVSVSRRLIADLRAELKIPCSRTRKRKSPAE